jgi:hypothetical protein
VADVTLVRIEGAGEEADLYLWSGVGLLDADLGDGAQTFYGYGRLGSVALAADDLEVQVTENSFTLSGVDEEYRELLETTVKGRKAWVWKAILGYDYAVKFTALLAECELDQPTLRAEPNGTITVSVAALGGFYFIDRQSAAVCDPQDQRDMLIALEIDPDTDTGFDLMSELKNTQLAWERSE